MSPSELINLSGSPPALPSQKKFRPFVPFLLPLKPTRPADDHAITLPNRLVIVAMVAIPKNTAGKRREI